MALFGFIFELFLFLVGHWLFCLSPFCLEIAFLSLNSLSYAKPLHRRCFIICRPLSKSLAITHGAVLVFKHTFETFLSFVEDPQVLLCRFESLLFFEVDQVLLEEAYQLFTHEVFALSSELLNYAFNVGVFDQVNCPPIAYRALPLRHLLLLLIFVLLSFLVILILLPDFIFGHILVHVFF